MQLFKKLRDSLRKTQESFVKRVDNLFQGRKTIDEELFEEMEAILIQSDLGVATAMDIVENIREKCKREKLSDPEHLFDLFKEEIQSMLEGSEKKYTLSQKPFVFFVIGVNGVGKTTTIGKLAWNYSRQGQKVMIVAGDTFRAAAVEQLQIWAERAGCTFFSKPMNTDPSAVIYEALHKALKEEYTCVFVDTAGRLHTRGNLLDELKKMNRVARKVLPEAPQEVVIVLDASTGQNAMAQVRTFHEHLPLTSMIITKLDGTSRGGIAVSLYHDYKIPISHIGVGEKIEDLQEYSSREFVEALFLKSGDEKGENISKDDHY